MSEFTPVPNILAERYASTQMRGIWAFEKKIRRERLLWLCILKAQRELGLNIPEASEAAFEAKVDEIDLGSIAQREARTRHDLKARIEEFCELAGYQHIHLGLTSRDITENVEQAQMRDALLLLRGKAAAVLACLCSKAQQYSSLVMAGRTHNVVAQVTTLGKRFATCGEELMVAMEAIDALLGRMRLRGLKGPVGTQQDLFQLFNGDYEKIKQLEMRVAQHLGFEGVQTSSAQVYPRSFDATDAVLDNFLAVLEGLEISEESLGAEVRDWMIALSSTKVLSMAVALGLGREEAHKVISRHILDSDEATFSFTSIARFARDLGSDKAFPLNETQVLSLFEDEIRPSGAATHQVKAFLEQADVWIKRFPEARKYAPKNPI